MADATTARSHAVTTWSIALSVLMLAAGLLAIALPLVVGMAITVIVAWLLLFSGALHVAFAWRGHGAGGVLWEILVGLAYGVIGFYLLARPMAGLASLTLALAFYLCIEAALEFVLWSRLRAARGRGWLLADGIITLVLATMIWSTWPSSSSWVLGTIVGISMLFSGVSRLALSLALRRLAA